MRELQSIEEHVNAALQLVEQLKNNPTVELLDALWLELSAACSFTEMATERLEQAVDNVVPFRRN